MNASHSHTSADPRLIASLILMIAVGASLLLALPGMRGYHPQIGWMPLWLLGMPLSALLALWGAHAPWTARVRLRQQAWRPRSRPVQARRHARGAVQRRFLRAA